MIDSTRMTAEGSTVGTANYLSPEQVLGADIDKPSDVYSLGLVLIEALTGAVAFPGHGVEAALARLHRQPQVPSRINPRLAHLLTRMTARDPSARPSAGEAGAELAVIADPSLLSEVLALGQDAGELPTQVLTRSAERTRRSVVSLARRSSCRDRGLGLDRRVSRTSGRRRGGRIRPDVPRGPRRRRLPGTPRAAPRTGPTERDDRSRRSP